MQELQELPELPDGARRKKAFDRFPLGVMSGVAKRHAELFSSYLEQPAEFFYVSFLTCLGAMIAGRVGITSEVSPDPRLYTLILGDSADDRKSTAIKKTMPLFVDKFHRCNGVGSAEGLQSVLSKHPSTLLVYDEFKSFISKARIDSSVLLECVSSLFEDNLYDNHTKMESIELRDIYLSILAASTIDTYEGTWSSAFTDLGLNNRMFIVPGSGSRRFPSPKMIPEADKQSLVAGISEIDAFVGKYRRFPWGEGAEEYYNKWYLSLSTSIHTKRIDGYAWRLALIIASNDMADKITLDIIKRAIKMVDWQISVRQIYDPIDADTPLASMEERIRRYLAAHNGRATQRQLSLDCHAHRSGIDCFKRAIGNLRINGEIARNGSLSCGKSTVWDLVNDNDETVASAAIVAGNVATPLATLKPVLIKE
jgi:hypothetical protein